MTFFVRLDDPVAARRMVLESDKDVLHALKGYYELLAVRERKRQTVAELRRTIRELNALMEEAEKFFPEQHVKGIEQYLPKERPAEKIEKQEPPKQAPAKKTENKAEKQVKKRPLTDVEKLSQALANIEQRLDRL